MEKKKKKAKLQKVTKYLNNHVKISDWSNLQDTLTHSLTSQFPDIFLFD